MKLEIEITLLSPTIISENSGDPNLVGTEKFIAANTIRGAMITQYINHNKISGDAHLDKDFFDFFFSGKLLFSDAWIGISDNNECKETQPIPYFLQKTKRNDNKIFNLATSNQNQQTSLIESFYYQTGKDIHLKDPAMNLSMHHARKNRRAGCSLEGEIYNYESLSPEQTFIGFIQGEKRILEEFKNKLPDFFFSYLGRSRNTQYGKTKVKIKDIMHTASIPDIADGDRPILCLLTPAIFYNDNGFPEVSKGIVERYLKEITGEEVKIINVFAKSKRVEQFNRILQCKTPSVIGFKAGTSFVLDINQNAFDRLKEHMVKGFGERICDGFGLFCIYHFPKDSNDELNLISTEENKEIKIPEGELPLFLKEKLKMLMDKRILNFSKSEGINKQDDFTVINNHTISRLESGLEHFYHPKNREAFPENFIKAVMDQLKLKAQDNIKSSTNKKIKMNMVDFLQIEDPVEIPDDMKLFIQNLKQNYFQYEIDKPVKQLIYYHFWMNFLRSMRKRNQTIKEGEKNG